MPNEKVRRKAARRCLRTLLHDPLHFPVIVHHGDQDSSWTRFARTFGKKDDALLSHPA